MKTLKNLAILALLLMGLSVSALAQTTTTRTTLTNAITDTSSTLFVVASTTGFVGTDNQTSTSPAWGVYIDGEYMEVRTVISSTQFAVTRRGVGGRAALHPATEIMWAGPRGPSGPFFLTDGTPGQPAPGRCTRGTLGFAPVINITTGNVWDCILSTTATTANWSAYNFDPIYNSSRPYKKLATTATTYTALPADFIIGYNTNNAGTITLPGMTGAVGKEYRIQIEVTGSVSLTIASSNGQTINGAATIIIGGATSFSGAYLYFDGSNWFTPRAW